MNKPKYIHEAKEIMKRAEVEYTQTNSLSASSAFNVVHACDLALRELYFTAVSSSFPSNQYKPHHQPGSLAKQIGIFEKYSDNTQSFLSGLEGRAIADARYPESQGYKNYTNKESASYSKQLIRGANQFIGETLAMERDENIINSIQQNVSKVNRVKCS